LYAQDVAEMEHKFLENAQQPFFLLPLSKSNSKCFGLKKKKQNYTKSMGHIQT